MLQYLAKKTFLTTFIIAAITTIVMMIFKVESLPLRVVIYASTLALLMPRRKKIDTQTGKKTQITWFLLKEPIFIDE